MYLFKVSILLFSNLLIQISTLSFATSQTPRLRTRKSGHDYNNCVCFPGGPSLIPELLNPQVNGLERLVVQIYRDVNTNQIKVFIPGPEKQALIPNIPFAPDDVMKIVTTETIASLINPYPLTDGGPIGLKWGTVQQVSPKPGFISIFDEYPNQGSPKYPQQGYPQPIYPQQRFPQITPNPSNIYEPYQNQPKIWNNPEYLTVPRSPVNYEVISNTQNVYTWQPNKKNVGPLSPYQPGQFNPYQPNGPYGPFGPPNKQDVYAPAGPSKRFITFDQWFNRQMETFQDARSPQDIKAINIDLLRTLVQKTLFENHMHIGSTGLITDVNGAPINLDNLELRPILIGNSVTYQQVLKGAQPLTLPQHLPYLEGILITLVYPPKVLGVIPLGKTYVSPSGLPVSLTTPRASIDHYQTGSGPNYNLGPLSGQINPFSGVSSPQYQNGYYTLPSPNVYQGSQSTIGWQPNFGGTTNSYVTADGQLGNPNQPNANYIWGPQSNYFWQRRSNQSPKTPKPPRNPKAPVDKTHKSAKLAIKLSKPSNGTASSNVPKPSPRSSNSYRPLVADSKNGWKSSHQYQGDSGPAPDAELDLIKNYPGYDEHGNKLKSQKPIESEWHSSIHALPHSKLDIKTPQLSAIPLTSSSGGNQAYYPYDLSHSASGFESPVNIKPHLGISPIGKAPRSNSGPSKSQISHLSLVPIGHPHYNPYPYHTNGHHQPKIKPDAGPVFAPDSGYIPFGAGGISSNNYLGNYDSSQNQNIVMDSGNFQPKPTGSTRRFPVPSLQGVIKTIINMVLKNLSASAGITRRTHADANVNISNPIEKNGDVQDGERPDFRIIGGSPATGSGSPLNNKGRSGIGFI